MSPALRTLPGGPDAASTLERETLRGQGTSAAGAIAVAIWMAATVLGMWFVAKYEATPGVSGAAPARFPGATEADGNVPRLMMFAHPQCPCTQASLAEFAELLARHPGSCRAEVVFFRPEGVEDDWERTSLWSQAARIPGVAVRGDDDGALARRFGAETSGHVVLYDAGGRLLFSGGITRARGHQGESTARRALSALLTGSAADAAQSSPVFGCPLQGPEAAFARPGSRSNEEGLRDP